MNEVQYFPEERMDLLKKAGLYQNNKKVIIKAYVSSEKNPIDPDKPLYDYRNVKEVVAGMLKPNSKQIYSWTDGLTKEEISIINTECGVDTYDEDTRISVKHNMVLDLSVPASSALYMFLKYNPVIGQSPEDCKGGQCRFYWHDSERIAMKRSDIRSLKIEAFKLYESLGISDMRELLTLMGNQVDGMSDIDTKDLFGEECEVNYKLMLERHKIGDRDERVFLNKILSHGILSKDAETKRIMRKDSIFATDYDAALLVIKDPASVQLIKSLQAELRDAQGGPEVKKPENRKTTNKK